MKENLQKIFGDTIGLCLETRIKEVELAVNDNNFNKILDTVFAYLKLEETLRDNGYGKQIRASRIRLYEIAPYLDLKRMRFE